MISIIICEGTTDLTLLQYFLEKTYRWNYIKNTDLKKIYNININLGKSSHTKWFKNKDNFLCIKASGGSTKIIGSLDSVLEINSISIDAIFQNIVIISDNDDENTLTHIINDLEDKFRNYDIQFQNKLDNNNWNETTFINATQDQIQISVLPLIIPFDETGAIETFLLNAIRSDSLENDPAQVDKNVVDQCIEFIDSIDCSNKYLTHRRDKIKAKFDTVFVVMTPATAFSERQQLLRNVPWEEYETIQENFKKLNHLG